ncbi:Otx2 transcription factor [Parasponia andersonii]|uniref:Otx2 transcription factor n=1 Tax=Parasponia andersonii TaxID=3476 RepID=A0A2P5BIH3_PARAD|nr:Otx2 transcription factor [Parasponia andersonii]
MATKSTLPEPSPEPQPKQTSPAPSPVPPPAVKPETSPAAGVPVPDSGDTPKPSPPVTTASSRPPEPSPSSDGGVAHVPSYARWFSWDNIHQCEVRFLPEFFDSRSQSKNPRVYKYYRNSIVKHYRADPSRKITFTEVRKTLVGDVGSVRRVFDFLEAWGLINYSPSALNKPLKWEDKDTKTSSAAASSHGGASKDDNPKRVCNHCKSVCSIACFVCDKNNMTLCARCYVRGNYQLGGVSSSDFRRVEIHDNSKTDWMEKDTLHLLEAVMHYGDDWRKVARHVGRGEKECVAHFIKLPFGEEFISSGDSGNVDDKYNLVKDHADAESCASSLAKRMRLTPLADASNPIMAQATFLSALAGVEVAEAAAQAAVTALSDDDYVSVREKLGSREPRPRLQEAIVASNENAADLNAADGALADANTQLEQEEHDVERAISGILEVQMKEIKDKIDRFEALDLLMEKEWRKLELTKNMLFVDQLTLIFHKNSAQKTGERMEERNVKTD